MKPLTMTEDREHVSRSRAWAYQWEHLAHKELWTEIDALREKLAAAERERDEARALRQADWPSPPWKTWEADAEHEREGYRRMATHVLRERHERERPLVEALRGAVSRLRDHGFCPADMDLAERINDTLGAHARLDAEPMAEPTPEDLQNDIERSLNTLMPGHAATVRELAESIALLALARERGAK